MKFQNFKIKYSFSLLWIVLLIGSCTDEKKPINPSSKTQFTMLFSESTNIDFENKVVERPDFHPFNYPYIYNGGGVAIGDINNDGLQDIYFTSNQNSNKLYVNEGNFEFKDITLDAGVSDERGWTTGVNMIDINNDGWLDIYVCKSAVRSQPRLRQNKLYINQKDNTFKEEASKWRLADDGFSVQSYFFDYDNDGDLDMFLVNHRDDFFNSINLDAVLEDRDYFPQTSDHLYRNDGKYFTDVTIESGLMNKEFSLSASIGDFNNDGWSDIFVANDFITPDKLYINKKDGTFVNEANSRFKHTTYSSMGSDYADINNDMLPDLMVLDMSAEDHSRGKQNMATMDVGGFWKTVNSGFHYAYMSNVLNLNKGNGLYNDIAQFADVSKTDWSWAPLMADFDNDGFKDIFITNGVKRELGNQDFGKRFSGSDSENYKKRPIREVLELLPSTKLQNYIYKNNRDLTFKKVSDSWGFEKPINSNGAAYADLDNDGDLDLVVNNMDDKASVYRNNSSGNFLTLQLKGNSKNINGIGAKVHLFAGENQQYQELFLSRGFQSSVPPILHFGIGDQQKIQRIEVRWDQEKMTVIENIDANQLIIVQQENAINNMDNNTEKTESVFTRVNPTSVGISYTHDESVHNDFSKQVLLPQEQSQLGPAMAVGDINNDGLEDLFMGGGMGQAGVLYVQSNDGSFNSIMENLFSKDSSYEDNGATFFDANGDGYLDLYITSGSYELSESDPFMQDRLYINNNGTSFRKSNNLPEISSVTKAVLPFDYDSDGDLDLIVGGRVVPGKYPLNPRSYILENNNGRFIDVTEDIAPEFRELGMINDMIASDMDGDGQSELIIVGEWMPITVFKFQQDKFENILKDTFSKTEGWWNTISHIDFDNDGDMDYFVGNLGGNNKFKPNPNKPLHIYGNNFDNNDQYDMVLSKLYNGELVPIRGKECSTEQNPFLANRIKSYKEFANSSLEDIYGQEKLSESFHKKVFELRSLYIENLGQNKFKFTVLPSIAQLGPIMSFVFEDVNKDGHMDVLGSGAIHEAEVETVRYDGNTGYILFGDSKGGMNYKIDKDFYNDKNAKKMLKIKTNDKPYIIIANNNQDPTLFSLN